MDDFQIPKDAESTVYTAGRHTAKFWIWRRGDLYYWEALGQTGSKPTYEAAATAAKAWIRDRQLI